MSAMSAKHKVCSPPRPHHSPSPLTPATVTQMSAMSAKHKVCSQHWNHRSPQLHSPSSSPSPSAYDSAEISSA
eukprot:5814880-Prymnesium_polylepis.1